MIRFIAPPSLLNERQQDVADFLLGRSVGS
jgi:hypothetical protein